MSDPNAPLTGPDGQPLLGMIGDLGDGLVSDDGSSGLSGGGGGTGTSPFSNSNSNLTINITYDQVPSSLPSGFVSAINYVVSYYESLFTTATPTTVNIDVGYGTVAGQALEAGALGESETYLNAYSYSQIKSALASSDPSAAASLPASQPVSGTMWLATAEAKALGLETSSTFVDGYAGFASSFPFTYDPNNRAVPGKYDFIGVVEHEFTEIMGRIDIFGYRLDGVNPGYSLLDMFHYTSPGVHTYTGTTTNYFSANGGATNLDNFNTIPGGDPGDWASSAGADSYLAFSPTNQADVVSQADVTVMNALGYATVLAPPLTVEAFGSTALVEQGNFFFLDSIATGTGPEVKMGGLPVGVNQITGMTAIGAEAITGGYDLVWHESSSNLYSIWNLDSSGNYLSAAVVSGTGTTLENLEPTFHQDLNGDGVIGIPSPVTLESHGATSLVQEGNFFFLDPVGSTGPVVTMGGVPIGAGQVGGWTAIGAEAGGVGYEMAWHMPGTNLYTVWNLDGGGNFLSDTIGAVAGTSLTLENLELGFQQDLNGDGTIGPPLVTLESSGVTSLVQQGDFLFLNPVAGGTGPEVQMNGAPIGVSQIGGWTPIGAEAVSGGYEVAFHLASSNLYTVWNLDSTGHFLSDTLGAVAANNLPLENLETSFHQDLNGDSLIGPPAPVTLEALGSTSLVQQSDFLFLNPVGGGTGPEVQMSGAPIGVSQIGGWTPIGAEQTAGGYEVAFHQAGSNLYTVWNLDTMGNFVSDTLGAVAANSMTLEALEPSFHQDLNGDGTTGLPTATIEALGSTALVQQGDFLFLNPVGGSTGPEVQMNGAPIGVSQTGGWTPIGGELVSGGYEVAFHQASSDLYTVWNLDTAGNFLSDTIGAVAANSMTLEALEPSFHQDLNGDGTTGIIGIAGGAQESGGVFTAGSVVALGSLQLTGSAQMSVSVEAGGGNGGMAVMGGSQNSVVTFLLGAATATLIEATSANFLEAPVVGLADPSPHDHG